MRPKAAWRTVSGVSTCLLIGMIAPSILTFMGEFEVKNRSLALRSTMSLNSGRVFNTIGALSADLASWVSSSCSFTAAIWNLQLERAALLFFVDDRESAAVVEVLDLALA